MKLLISTTALALLAASSSTSAQRFCGQYDSKVVPPYTVYNNLWGKNNDPSGTQCTEVLSPSGEPLSWNTSFNWAGERYQVKSFANAALTFPVVQVSSVRSIPTSIDYKYTYEGEIITNFAYDLFTSSSENGAIEYEVMVWLTALGGAWPLSTAGHPIGSATVNNVEFDLYQGMNKQVKVFSYVARKQTTSFKADLKVFFDQLPTNNNVPETQFLQKLEAGTEPFLGKNAELTVSSFSVKVVT
ncbi:unnamed protein product [Hyaloperonospora brassicae]|uniref:Cell 12A endoglucanase n=1 Tax=Hyaloperonospora brassicae TaxID=162125 RepID=A0AAV0UZU3_HYABA|nr:unnamed protein product [Hyaloperonospora brassicae]